MSRMCTRSRTNRPPTSVLVMKSRAYFMGALPGPLFRENTETAPPYPSDELSSLHSRMPPSARSQRATPPQCRNGAPANARRVPALMAQNQACFIMLRAPRGLRTLRSDGAAPKPRALAPGYSRRLLPGESVGAANSLSPSARVSGAFRRRCGTHLARQCRARHTDTF